MNILDSPMNEINYLFEHYFNHPYNELIKLDDGIYWTYDTSIQGESEYQYEFITDNEDLIKLYDGLVKVHEAQLSLNE